VIGSDAHIDEDVGKFDRSLEIVKEAGLTEKDVINSSLESINKHFINKGRKRFLELSTRP